jgi:transcriptional regulator with XRE-family HTH domain
MAGQKIELGATGRTVAENIKRARGIRSFNYTDLSRRLGELGRPIPALAIRRIEEGARRVDVDDLLAIAVALEVSPVVLLSPDVGAADVEVEATGVGQTEARRLWDWFRSENPLKGEGALKDWLHAQMAVPEWRRQEIYEGVSTLLEISKAELEAREGDPARLNQLIEQHRRRDGDD